MDTAIGIVGKDFVFVATDAMAGRSIMVYKNDEDKALQVNDTTLIAMSGPQGDRSEFGSFIKANIALSELRNNTNLLTSEIAHYTRSELHKALRSGPFQVNLLIGGVDSTGPELYYMDYLGSMAAVKFGVHGHASNFLLSILDSQWKADMTLEEVQELFRKCLHELNTRFLIDLSSWKLRVLTNAGIEEIPSANF